MNVRVGTCQCEGFGVVTQCNIYKNVMFWGKETSTVHLATHRAALVSALRISEQMVIKGNVPIIIESMGCVTTLGGLAKMVNYLFNHRGRNCRLWELKTHRYKMKHYKISWKRSHCVFFLLPPPPPLPSPPSFPLYRSLQRRRKGLSFFFFFFCVTTHPLAIGWSRAPKAGRKVRHLTSRVDVGMRGGGTSTPWLYERRNPSRGRACGRRT